MQALTDYRELLKLIGDGSDEQLKTSMLLYQYVTNTLEFAKTAKHHGINVLNIYSGTYRLNNTSILDNAYQWRPLRLDPLTVDDGLHLLSAKHPTLAEDMKSREFKHVVLHLGNIPRIWRIFSEIITTQNVVTLDTYHIVLLEEHLMERVSTRCINHVLCNHCNNLIIVTDPCYLQQSRSIRAYAVDCYSRLDPS